MASESSRRASFVIVASLLLGACAGAGRFPLRPPLLEDTDRRPVNVRCRERPSEDDPKHVSCAPEPYVSPLVWDGADNSFFRPLSDLLAVKRTGEALNVNAFDEVPDSAWFQNRLGKRKLAREELLRGACEQRQLLEPESAEPGSWLIDRGKPNGATPGFRVKLEGQGKYMLKTDSLEQPERPSAAGVIGAAIYHVAGFNTSCEQIIYLDPAILKLKSGLHATDNTGISRPFDAKALRWVLANTPKRGKLSRLQASAWLPGYLLGPFQYEGTRWDDPNDVIPHEDRRELRGGRLLAAWLNHFDAREQNTMDSWIASNPEVEDSSPGFVRHYYLDTSDSFGSEWADDGISRRLGRSYVFDLGDIGLDFVTFGGLVRPWEKARRTPGYEIFGYYHFRDFDPEAWKNEYPNPAFSRATERDNAWMARILARLTRDDIETLVSLGKFSRPEHAAFLTELLEQRLRKILDRYLLRLSPLTDLRLAGDGQLCATDLSRARRVRPEQRFHYRARLERGDRTERLAVRRLPAGEICVKLPHAAPDGRIPDADVARYRVVTLANGGSRYVLRAHLYDLGPRRGFRLVGIERPEETFE